jgi:hypothetical protein
MEKTSDKLSYHKSADRFLRSHVEKNAGTDTDTSFFFSYRFAGLLAAEAKQIARSLSLKGMDYRNAIVATWFRYAGIKDPAAPRTEAMKTLLNDFFREVDYPEADRLTVEDAITAVELNRYAATGVEQTVSDAVNSQLAQPDFIENLILLNDEVSRHGDTGRTELFYAKLYLSIFIQTRYYTDYANGKYALAKGKNFQLLEKRVQRLEEAEKIREKGGSKQNNNLLLTNKETEDLFKIAFRNYNHLISVADSKASLLIRVNSIIISVMLAFVIRREDKNTYLFWPTLLILAVALLTILLSVLASRPQKSSFLEDSRSHSYQKFFFGSFDLVDPGFRLARWEVYYRQLSELFSQPKETILLELYKESFNVRKVLAKKFNYLSRAYWVFLVGLMISIIAFVLAIHAQTPLHDQ